MGKFRYLAVTNRNDMRKETKGRIKWEMHLIIHLRTFYRPLLSKKLKVMTYQTIILPFVLCGCETWSLTLREEHRLRVFEIKVLKKIFGAKRRNYRRMEKLTYC